MDLWGWLGRVRVSGVIDIAIMTLVIYGVLLWLRRTRRAALILTGILIVAASYLLALWFDLVLTVAVLQGFFAIFLLALVIIFQEELRYFFERIAQWSLRPYQHAWKRGDRRLAREDVEILSRTLGDLAVDRVGALVVVRGRDLITRHLKGGIDLDGDISEAVIKSIFDAHSEGHDGALVIDRGKILSFACHLPLSNSYDRLRGLGTRHAAALGLSELSDALCLVVSEERGTISVAHSGDLRRVEGPDGIREALERFYDEFAPRREGRRWYHPLVHNWRERIVAVVVALGLWFGLVHGSETIYRSYRVPVELPPLPQNVTVESVRPTGVYVTLSGPRRAFLFLRPGRLHVAPRAWDLVIGTNVVAVSSADLSFPENLTLERVDPQNVTVRLVENPAPGAGP